jgi:ElaA protein
MQWSFKRLNEFTPHELYELLQLRSEVFVVEQQCVFQDMDGTDDKALHLLGRENGELIAYSRCYDKGIKYAEASIGRVITRGSARRSGLGHALMQESMAQLCKAFGTQPIRIGAQARLERFYNANGFVTSSESYIEDGIPHIEMLWMPLQQEKS